jgi:hypothetical protein
LARILAVEIVEKLTNSRLNLDPIGYAAYWNDSRRKKNKIQTQQ